MDIDQVRRIAGLVEGEHSDIGARGSNTKIEVMINGKLVLAGTGVLKENHGTCMEFLVYKMNDSQTGYVVMTPPLQGLM